MKKLSLLILFAVMLLNACAPTATAVPPTETPQPENIGTATIIPTATNSSIFMTHDQMLAALKRCVNYGTYNITTLPGATLKDIAYYMSSCYGEEDRSIMAMNIVGWQQGGWNSLQSGGALPPGMNIIIYGYNTPASSVLQITPAGGADLNSLLQFAPPVPGQPTETPLPEFNSSRCGTDMESSRNNRKNDD